MRSDLMVATMYQIIVAPVKSSRSIASANPPSGARSSPGRDRSLNCSVMMNVVVPAKTAMTNLVRHPSCRMR
jgi:hypothetical protein